VAGLLLPMTRALPALFLRYWTCGWVSLTIALFALFISFRCDPGYRELFLICYCLAEYLFGFLLWAGCREAVTGQILLRAHFTILIPPAVFGILAPLALHDLHHLFPFHSVVVGFLFLFALLSLTRIPKHAYTPTTGLWLLRGSLTGLTLLFFHYSLVTWFLVYVRPDLQFDYMAFSSLYDVLLETGLAFGMVIWTTDRLRGELAEKNAQLAAAAAELAVAARSDSLTGLLNRRALDDHLNDPSVEYSPGGVAVLDMNDLKWLNDKHGHTPGDVALQLIARSLRVHFRVTDPIYRIGGDEFVIVMPGCTESDLAARLTQIDLALAGQRIPGVPDVIDIGIAWGVTPYTSRSELRDAIRKADLAMYECKRERKKRSRMHATHDNLPDSMGGL